MVSYANVLCGARFAMISECFVMHVGIMRTSCALSYASYARQPMRYKTLHKIKCKNQSYAVLCASWALQAKVLCASYVVFLFFDSFSVQYSTLFLSTGPNVNSSRQHTKWLCRLGTQITGPNTSSSFLWWAKHILAFWALGALVNLRSLTRCWNSSYETRTYDKLQSPEKQNTHQSFSESRRATDSAK